MSEEPRNPRTFPGDDPVLAMRFLDRYEPLVRLAEGGMAEVYVARVRGEAGFEKLVALKRMLPHLAEEPRFVDMFLDEARLAALVQSPNVVQTLDLGRAADGSLFLVMELVLGVSVSRLQKAARLAEGAIPPAVALAIVVKAAAGLHDAHEAVHPDGQGLGLVHRDVSPQNVLVDGQGQVRVTDFGIARALERRTHSMSGEVKGKIAYFSPEQAAGEPVDRRTDVFALGVVAWELLAGRRLFEAADTAETLERLQAPLPPAAELRAQVDATVVEVVYRALERDPDQRYATAEAFGEALRRAAQEADLLADRAALGGYVRDTAGPALAALQERIRTARHGDEGEHQQAPKEEGPGSVRSDAPTRQRDATPSSPAPSLSTVATPAPRSRKSSPNAATAVIGPRKAARAAPGDADGNGSGEAPPADPEVATKVEDPATWGPSPRALRGRSPAHRARTRSRWLVLISGVLGIAGAAILWWQYPQIQQERHLGDGAAPAVGLPPDGSDSSARLASPSDAGASASAPGVRPPPSARKVLRIGGRGPRRFRGGFLAEGLYEGLLRRGLHGRLVPHVALRKPSLDGPDAKLLPGGQLSVTWRLRPGMRWSDGKPLHARDLVFGVQVYAPAELLRATATDAHTVELRWRDRVAVAFRNLHPLPRHALEPVYKKGGSEAVLKLLRRRPVPGLGPYRVRASSTAKRIVLEANPHYAGPPPATTRVELHLSDGPALERRFLAGELDVTLPNAITLESAERIRRSRPTAVHLRPSNKQLILQPDLRHPLLAKREVRQALLRAINRKRIARRIYGRYGQVSHLPIPRIRPTGLRRYKYAPTKARQALREALRKAGTPGATGAPRATARQIPLFHGDHPTGRRIAALVAADLGKAGLRVTLQERTFPQRRKLFRQGNHGGLLLYGLLGLNRWPLRHWWSVPRRQGRYLRTARHAALDDWVAALMERESRALDWRKRRELRDQVWVAYSERLPHLPLVFATERILADPALRGWDFRAGHRFGVGLAHWYFTR